MRASVYVPNSSASPRMRIALDRDEFTYLSAGLKQPKAHVEGDVIGGLVIRFSDHSGMTIKLNPGNTVEFSVTETHVRSAAGRIPAQSVLTVRDRTDLGPILRTESFPKDFFRQFDKNTPVNESPLIVRARAEKTMEALQKNGSMNITQLKEAIHPPLVQEPARAAPRPPVVATVETSVSIITNPVDDVKQAIALLNGYMDGLDDTVTLIIENNRVRATKRVVHYEDL
jgi:hypothetical protein